MPQRCHNNATVKGRYFTSNWNTVLAGAVTAWTGCGISWALPGNLVTTSCQLGHAFVKYSTFITVPQWTVPEIDLHTVTLGKSCQTWEPKRRISPSTSNITKFVETIIQHSGRLEVMHAVSIFSVGLPTVLPQESPQLWHSTILHSSWFNTIHVTAPPQCSERGLLLSYRCRRHIWSSSDRAQMVAWGYYHGEHSTILTIYSWP